MNTEEFPNDSDTSDEDYVPSEKQEDLPSEVDSDGVVEEPYSDLDNSKKKGQKRKRKATKTKKKLKDTLQETDETKADEDKLQGKDNKKQSVDDIWADFMKDTGFRPKNSKQDSNLSTPKSQLNKTTEETSTKPSSQNGKVKITQVFEFAGEEVKVEKEVSANSAEARLLTKPDEAPKTSRGKKGGLSGISNVLSQLGKKPKISTLEKSKLDWDKFKKEEDIEEELQTYNKGKEGFLERQDFLQRADLRRFEIEKDIRAVERSKRFNSTF